MERIVDHSDIQPVAPDISQLGTSTLSRMTQAIERRRTSETKRLLSQFMRECRGIHDMYSDWVWELYDYIADTYGEEELFKAAKKIQTLRIKQAVESYRVMTPEQVAQAIPQFLRGHHSGPGRSGDMGVRDEGDRYAVVIDPCGSGGRMRRGDTKSGVAPRTGPPYNFGVVKGAYPWTWSKPNVGRYCMHCAVGEILFIESLGYPPIITEYPDNPDDPCILLVYKNPKEIPDRYFRRVGKSPPRR